jgi:RNA polymerase sigma-70 factor (ECF subfamily)
VTPEEFTSHYRTQLPAISKYLVRRVAKEAVEELASSVFEIAWQKRNQAPEGFELAWLYRIAGYVVSNHRRKSSRAANFLAGLRAPNAAPSAEDIALGDMALAEAWATLKPSEQQVIALVSFEALDNSQAAKVLEISPNAFALRLSKARAKLRENLQ